MSELIETQLERCLRLLATGSTFVVSDIGYGISRPIKSGDLAGHNVRYKITDRTAKALKKKGFTPTEQFHWQKIEKIS